ncbi:MAG: DUF1616 domain-containing protein [Candidatus Bathyarchaeia archaeon]
MKSNAAVAQLEKLVKDAADSLDNPTLGELVDTLVTDKKMKPKDATKAVYTMWKQGSLNLSEANPPSTLTRYMFNLENAWFWFLTALVAVTFVFVFTVNAAPLLYVRYVLGGIFVLFLPGAMLVTALYPKSEDMDGLVRFALAIGLSLAIAPLVGLALNYTPWGITLPPITVVLAVLIEGLGFAALVRRFRYHQLSLKGTDWT